MPQTLGTLFTPDLADASRDRLMESLRDNSYGGSVSATMILDAIARREADARTATIERWTKAVGRLTAVIAAATIVNVALFIIRG